MPRVQASAGVLRSPGRKLLGHMRESSLYIHIPFCRKKCPYCSFYSVVYEEAPALAYIYALVGQIENINTDKLKVSTIYMGGGTPTLLNIGLLKKLLGALKRFTGPETEFTVEANPEGLYEEKLSVLLNGGVNRISIGMQSFNGQKLQRLGRMHTAQQATDAVSLAKKAGFNNISVDLIFGVLGETFEDWKSDLSEVSRLPVNHVSCYSLTYEENTELFKAKKSGSVVPLIDEASAEMYEYALDYLPLLGFKQYEISNFKKEDYPCRHNLNYWDNNPYIGIGASAVSYIDGVRQKNVSDISEYLAKYTAGETLIASSEKLSDIERAKETASLKIRTNDGLDLKWFRKKTGFDFLDLEKDVLGPLAGKGLIEYKHEKGRASGVRLTRKGLLFCDTVSSDLL